jgi:hypothetical protein
VSELAVLDILDGRTLAVVPVADRDSDAPLDRFHLY